MRKSSIRLWLLPGGFLVSTWAQASLEAGLMLVVLGGSFFFGSLLLPILLALDEFQSILFADNIHPVAGYVSLGAGPSAIAKIGLEICKYDSDILVYMFNTCPHVKKVKHHRYIQALIYGRMSDHSWKDMTCCQVDESP